MEKCVGLVCMFNDVLVYVLGKKYTASQILMTKSINNENCCSVVT